MSTSFSVEAHPVVVSEELPEFTHNSTQPITFMGRKWQGIGYAYYAAKFVSFPAVLNQIEQAPNLYAVKAIAYVNKDSRPANWASKRLTIRYRLIVTLVRGYPLLKEKLLKTGTRPIVNVEEHPFWGIGLDGAGENQVGKLLERLRALG